MTARLPSLIALAALLASTGVPAVAQQRSFSSGNSGGSAGGSSTMSPSVIGTSFVKRDANGAGTLDLLVLWRGSPGWFMRRTGRGSLMGSDAAGTFVRQGGVHLTVSFDAANRVARVLGEDVRLVDGANVILVDAVDDPSGPRVVKTLKVNGALGSNRVLNYLILETPELLDYLRCLTQIEGPQNGAPMNYACSSALATGKVSGTPTMTPIPQGSVTNRAADPAGPPMPAAPAGPSESSSSRVLSPVVAGSWFVHQDATGSSLDLLVLWRGSPGWHMKGTGGGGSGGGSSMTGRRLTARYGGLVLSVLLDASGTVAQIEGKDVPLNDHNVVLVDDVDAPTGLRVIKTLRVDPTLPDTRSVHLAIRRSPELVSFLRCDVKLPDARQQPMMDAICAQVIGR